MKKAALTIIFCLVCMICFSQQTDSLNVKNDRLEAGNEPAFKKYQKVTRYAFPLVLIGYGFTSLNKGMVWRTDKELNHELLEEIPGFSTNIDDKLQYAPVALVYTLGAL